MIFVLNIDLSPHALKDICRCTVQTLLKLRFVVLLQASHRLIADMVECLVDGLPKLDLECYQLHGLVIGVNAIVELLAYLV